MNIRIETVEEINKNREVCYEWGSYLLDEFGYDKAQGVLATYEDLGWISHDVREEMEDILLSSEIQADKDYRKPDIDWPPLSSLVETEFEEHAYSLHYILELSDENEFSEMS